MKVINDHDWDNLGQKFRSAEPFPSICIDNFLDKEFSSLIANSYPKYSEAKAIGKEWDSVNEKYKTQITDPSLFPSPVTELCKTLSSTEFLDILSRLTGIENLQWDPLFRGGGMHLTGPSGLLDVHVDFNYDKRLVLYRRLNILIYLNPAWNEEWGGRVELWDKDVKNCVQSFLPTHNRCVLFETSDYSFHGVNAVTCPKGITRNSFAAYYYTEEPGDNKGDIWGGNHSTIFKARPYEWKKKYWSMPIQKLKFFNQKMVNNLKSKPKS